MISGDAGIGKTRLAAEFADQMRADGLRVAWAACRQDGGTPPYWPFSQLLSRIGRTDALVGPGDNDPELARFLLFDGVAAALREAAPVLLILDDLQWADEPSLRLLAALDAHLGQAAVLVLGTYRDTEPGADRIGDVRAERRIVLHGLSAAELGPAIAELTGERITVDATTDLHRRTGGNPFFASEVVRLERAERSLPVRQRSPVPGGVRAVLERRIALLPPAVELVMRAAATLDAGSTAGVDAVLLATVAGYPPAELASVAKHAAEARLLLTDGDRYRFPHALIADTVTARTAPAERLEMHRRAGVALQSRATAGLGDPAEAAYHLLSAARLSGDWQQARAAALAGSLAALSAIERTAYEDAVAWLESSLAVLANAADSPAAVTSEDPVTVSPPDRGELLCALGEAALAAGNPGRSRRAFTQAIEYSRDFHRPELLAASVLGLCGGAAGFEIDLADPDRTTLLTEALQGLPDIDSALLSMVSARLSVALSFTDAEQRRRELAETAVAMARRVGDRRALISALAARCDALAGPSHVDIRRSSAEEIIRCARQDRNATGELLGRRLRLLALAEAGDWIGVDSEIDSYDGIAAPTGQPRLTWLVPLWRGTRASMHGDLGDEVRQAAHLQKLMDLSGSNNARLLQLTQLFTRAVDHGRPNDILPMNDQFERLAPNAPVANQPTMSVLQALSGHRSEARRLLDEYLGGTAGRTPDSEWLPEMIQASMTALAVGHRAAAATISDLITPYAGMFAIEGIFAGTWGCVDAHLGRIARVLGRSAEADRYFADAMELNAAAGAALLERTRQWSGGSAAPDGASRGTPVVTPGLLRRDGEIWTIGYAGRTAQLNDSKGLRDLAVLLSRPGREVAAAELIGGERPPGFAAVELADRTAIASYRRRLIELDRERSEAQEMIDPFRVERLSGEYDALVAELSAVTGLGGRPREAGSETEKMRKAVGNRIRQAIARITRVHPELGRHLRVSIHTGTFCRYDPESRTRWDVSGRKVTQQ